MQLFSQILIIFSVCYIGEGISLILPFPFPASVISMLLLLLLLCKKWLPLGKIETVADFLKNNMSFFFIPSSVGIIENFDILRDNILPFLFICIFTTILTFCVTAFTIVIVMKLQTKKGESL